jgi:hypothetical protein
MKKVAAGLLAASILSGGVTVAHAAGTPSRGPIANSINKVLSTLVTKGTITQAQANAIEDALKTVPNTPPSIQGKGNGQGQPQIGGLGGGRGPAGLGGGRNNLFAPQNLGRLNVITSTLGITSSALQTALQSGKSLADIAGSNATTLINALVAYDTTQINAQVTAGKITPTQASNLISNLNKVDTAEVNRKAPQGYGFGHWTGNDSQTATSAQQ